MTNENTQQHEASHGLSATAELLVVDGMGYLFACRNLVTIKITTCANHAIKLWGKISHEFGGDGPLPPPLVPPLVTNTDLQKIKKIPCRLSLRVCSNVINIRLQCRRMLLYMAVFVTQRCRVILRASLTIVRGA